VALKALVPRDGDERLVAALRSEFRLLATLSDPRLAMVHDFGRLPPGALPDGSARRAGYFYTRDLIEGEDLGRAASGRGMREVAGLLGLTALALDVVHRAGAVHGDLKPGNVIVAADGRPHLIDFGFARAEAQPGTWAGTPAYLAPEWIRGELGDRRSDLYALGVMLFELCSGEHPSGSTDPDELLRWHLQGPVPRLAERRSDLAAVDGLLVRLLARDPDGRYPSAAEAAAALLAVAGLALPERTPARPVLRGSAHARAIAELESTVRARLLDREAGPGLLLLCAETGAGKRDLLRELRWRAQIAGIEALHGDFGAGEARPLGELPELLDQLAALCGTTAPGPPADALDEASRWRRPEEIARFVQEAVRRFPLLLLLDGLERTSGDAVTLLRFLSHALERDAALIVAGVTPRVADALGEAPSIALGPLTLEEVGVALQSAWPQADARLLERVFRQTGGLPALVGEAARAEPGGDPEKLSVPASVEEAYQARVAMLDHPARRCAEALAVLARPAQIPLLCSIAGSAVDEKSLASLSAAGVLARDAAGPSLHAAAAALVLAAMPAARRRELHRRAAQALRREGVGPAELVRHLLGAGERVAALGLLGAALDELVAAGALRAALALGEALLLRMPATRSQVHGLRLRLAEIARAAGDGGRALALARPLVAARVAERGRALVLLGRVHAESGRTAEAEGLFRRALADDRSSAGAAAGRELAMLLVRLGRAAEAEKLLLGAIPRAPEAMRGGLRAALALARGYRGDTTPAEAQLRPVLQEARARADRPGELFVLSAQAVIHFRQGELHQAAARWQEAVEVARALHDVERAASLGMNLAGCQLQLGEYGRYLANMEDATRMMRAVGAELALAQARVNLGHGYLVLGLWEQAAAELHAGAGAAARLGLERAQGLALQHEGLCDALRGDAERGRQRMAQAAEHFAKVGDPVLDGELWIDRAEIELLAGDAEAADFALGRADRAIADRPRDFAARHDALSGRVAACGPAAGRDAARARIGVALAALQRSAGPRPLQQELHAAGWDLAVASMDEAAAAEHAQAAAQLLESMAADLPPEVAHAFWQDPRRRAMREAALRAVAGVTTERRDGAPPIEERLFRILEINRQLNSELDPARLLERVMDAALELCRAERGLLLIDHDGDLRIDLARNVDRQSLESDGFSRSIAERTFRSGEAVVTVSARNDPRFRDARSVAQLNLEAVVCIPVRAGGKLCGVLYLESRLQPGSFGAEEVRLLQAFGEQAGLALHNARLLLQNAERARELERAQRAIERLAEERRELLERRTDELLRARSALTQTRARLESQVGRFGMVGRSVAMQRVFATIERVAAVDLPVLIEGESGTGKEMVARAVHGASPRRDHPLVSLNCAAVPEGLLESELFGHVRGAFTGAERDREGLFVAAQQGTLFLDEIGDMSVRMQVDLLRVLQEKKVRPVGGNRDVEVDVRMLCASHTPLAELVRLGRFREDLFYRLHVVTIRLPPLRERSEDVPLLVEHLLETIAVRTGTIKKTVTREAMRALREHGWPGNVRQLDHVLTNAHVLCDKDVIDVEDLVLDGPRREAPAPAVPATAAQRRTHERRRILEALEAAGWNRSRACERLGMPRRTFYRRLRAFGIL